METEDEFFEVGSSKYLQEKYGLFAENRPEIHLDADKIPPQFHALIPLAEKFGISDDIIRADFLDKTPPHELEELKAFIDEYDTPLDSWLAGPEAHESEPSEEYVAFSCLRMAAEEAEYNV